MQLTKDKLRMTKDKLRIAICIKTQTLNQRMHRHPCQADPRLAPEGLAWKALTQQPLDRHCQKREKRYNSDKMAPPTDTTDSMPLGLFGAGVLVSPDERRWTVPRRISSTTHGCFLPCRPSQRDSFSCPQHWNTLAQLLGQFRYSRLVLSFASKPWCSRSVSIPIPANVGTNSHTQPLAL
eukprot:3589338-Amphidinium_carterae.1